MDSCGSCAGACWQSIQCLVQLPAAALEAASVVVNPEVENPDLVDFYHYRTSEAARSMNAIQVEQQQEMLQLRQRTAALEQGQAALQQSLAEVQQLLQRQGLV